MTTKKNEVQATARLSELLAEELLSLSGRELEDAARAWGIDPTKSADRIDKVFRAAIKHHNQKRLRAAKAMRDRVVKQLSTASGSMHSDRDVLIRELSERLADLHRDSPGTVTIQHRNLSELSEADLESLLRQLSALQQK